MKLAVSNIGWAAEHDQTILPKLKDVGVEAIEVAPGRIFDTPALANVDDARAIGAGFAQAGLPVASMQALLFGQPDLHMLGDAPATKAFQGYLGHVIALAGALGCGPMVFGSPKNRLRGDMPFDAALDKAVQALTPIAQVAQDHGTVFCLEANARAYGCDFMTVLAEACRVARGVDHAGVGVVVDTGNMIMEDEPAEAVLDAQDVLRHVHLSAPGLAPVMGHIDFITRVLGHLRDMGYNGSVTLEMRTPEGVEPVETLLRNATAVRNALDTI